jgi:hypothetical protein
VAACLVALLLGGRLLHGFTEAFAPTRPGIADDSTAGEPGSSGGAALTTPPDGSDPLEVGAIIRPRDDADRSAAQVTEPNPRDFNNFQGKVVRWDACGPIDWKLRRGPGPENAGEVAAQALQQLSDATGLSFRYAGETAEVVDLGVDHTERTIYIAWATPDEVPGLEGSVAGEGGPSYSYSAGPGADSEPRPTAGSAVIDASAGLAPGFDGGASEGAVLLHELGHVMGLAHVDDPERLMYPSTVFQLPGAYQPGDLAALATAVDPRPCS